MQRFFWRSPQRWQEEMRPKRYLRRSKEIGTGLLNPMSCRLRCQKSSMEVEHITKGGTGTCCRRGEIHQSLREGRKGVEETWLAWSSNSNALRSATVLLDHDIRRKERMDLNLGAIEWKPSRSPQRRQPPTKPIRPFDL